jgi:hypothetical protein
VTASLDEFSCNYHFPGCVGLSFVILEVAIYKQAKHRRESSPPLI